MAIAVVAAILGAVSLAIMIVTDRLMVGDCYNGKPNHAWFVSSLAGSLFGLLLTAIIWIAAPLFDVTDTVIELAIISYNLLIWKGLTALFVGAIGIQILLHYFRCFSQEGQSAAIAAWLAATPIFVFAGMLLFSGATRIEGVSGTSTDPLWILGVIIATIGLIGFEKITGGPAEKVGVYRKELVKLLAFNILYAVLLKQTFSIERGANGTAETIALMPYYWIGFAAGVRVMFNRAEWLNFRTAWNRHIHFFILPIFFVEVVGMLVFFFEYVGISELDPTFVTLIICAHVFLVYVIDLALGWLRHWMERNGYAHLRMGGFAFVTENLPAPKFKIQTIFNEVCMITATTIGIALVAMVSF